jgi:dCTP deaminase
MLLSNKAVFEALDDGRLIIDPQPQPRFKSLSVPKTPYDATAINLTLGNIISVPKAGISAILDLSRGDVQSTLRAFFEDRVMDSTGYDLERNSFILAKTREKITLPMDRRDEWGTKPLLAARVEGKSSFARCGVLVHFTAPTIHCGFSGTITLEVICLGNYPIKLKPGMQICQLLVEEVVQDPIEYESQFQNQNTPAGQSI